MKRTLRRSTVGVVAVLLMSGAMAKADVVLDWNAITFNTIGSQNPFAQARFAAITQAAVFPQGRRRRPLPLRPRTAC